MLEKSREVLVEIRNLEKIFLSYSGFFSQSKKEVHAVSGVSFDIFKGETLGLVGESGCGKSTLGRCLLQLMPQTKGEVIYQGRNLAELDKSDLRKLRKKIQIIFQDPFSSLNPRMTVDQIISEPLEIHQIFRSKADRKKRIYELLDLCGLRKEAIEKYPHEFSGGQRQRINIARALAVQPEFIVCDEPVSSLDVSIQAQIINLLQDLQKEFGLTYLFISHDLKIVEHISNRIAVMYLGKLVELASTEEIIRQPKHPYTQLLLSSVLRPDKENDSLGHVRKNTAAKEPPSPIDLPVGCSFYQRCDVSQDDCKSQAPEWRNLQANAFNPHWVSCHYAKKS